MRQTISPKLPPPPAAEESRECLGEYCAKVSRLYDLQCDALREDGGGPAPTQEDALDGLLDDFYAIGTALSRLPSKSLCEIVGKIGVWRRLAPEVSGNPTADERLIASILADIERLHEDAAAATRPATASARRPR